VGNLVGAAVFVAGAYWYLYARDEEIAVGDTPTGDGRFTRDRRPEPQLRH
jgi:hypothetical protein